ncbi:hypothetical protein CRE_01281 [Caenorhabditis remanei]|uniref:Uncharacterized protein n=1 Tax=Caenorhabditis remanei TaxID=31234 RepID=E3N9R5_CAERE|nr:hypothetical protein CRE_01281 [Caenorhabditis remanei]
MCLESWTPEERIAKRPYRPQMGNLVPNKVWPRQSSALVLKALQEAEALEKASKDHELENLEILEETDSEDTPSEISETQKDPEFSENDSEDTHQPSEISETQSKIASLEPNYSHLLNLKIPFIFRDIAN